MAWGSWSRPVSHDGYALMGSVVRVVDVDDVVDCKGPRVAARRVGGKGYEPKCAELQRLASPASDRLGWRNSIRASGPAVRSVASTHPTIARSYSDASPRARTDRTRQPRERARSGSPRQYQAYVETTDDEDDATTYRCGRPYDEDRPLIELVDDASDATDRAASLDTTQTVLPAGLSSVHQELQAVVPPPTNHSRPVPKQSRTEAMSASTPRKTQQQAVRTPCAATVDVAIRTKKRVRWQDLESEPGPRKSTSAECVQRASRSHERRRRDRRFVSDLNNCLYEWLAALRSAQAAGDQRQVCAIYGTMVEV